jgi:C_GCAxxG_C_C family probable redox protein
MNEEVFRMFELHSQGFTCSQILLTMGLEAQGKTNPDLIKAVHGLAGGIGFSGKVCGALTGGVCLISLYAGRGTVEEKADVNFYDMTKTLIQWFEEEYGEKYGGINCDDIIGDTPNPQSFSTKCGTIVTHVYEKVKEILNSENYLMSGEKIDD